MRLVNLGTPQEKFELNHGKSAVHIPNDRTSSGWKAEISNKSYHNSTGISSSQFKWFVENPYLYQFNMKHHSTKETPAMRFGTDVHSIILEDAKWESLNKLELDLQIEYKKPKASKIYKKAVKDLKDKNIIALSGEEALMVTEWRKKINKDKRISDALEEKDWSEKCIYSHDPETNLLLKCRPDIMGKDNHFIIDLKTTIETNPAKMIEQNNYWIQAAFYKYVASLFYQEVPVFFNFYFLVLEKTPPCSVYFSMLSHEFMDRGMEIVKENLAEMAKCFKNNKFPDSSLDRSEHISPSIWWHKKWDSEDESSEGKK